MALSAWPPSNYPPGLQAAGDASPQVAGEHNPTFVVPRFGTNVVGARLHARPPWGACLALVGVAPVGRGDEVLLDHPRADPAEQVENRPRLVVGAGAAGAAERLLAND